MQAWQAVFTVLIVAFPEQWYVSMIVVMIICVICFSPFLLADTAIYRSFRSKFMGKSADDEDDDEDRMAMTPRSRAAAHAA